MCGCESWTIKKAEHSSKGLMLKLQYSGHLLWRTDSLEKTLMLGKIEGGRRRGQQRMRWLDSSPTQWTWVWVNSGSWWWTWRPGVLQSIGLQRVRHDWVTGLNWRLFPYLGCWIRLPWTWEYRYLFEIIISIISDINPEVELLEVYGSSVFKFLRKFHTVFL